MPVVVPTEYPHIVRDGHNLLRVKDAWYQFSAITRNHAFRGLSAVERIAGFPLLTGGAAHAGGATATTHLGPA